jgi:hypothetical protein
MFMLGGIESSHAIAGRMIGNVARKSLNYAVTRGRRWSRHLIPEIGRPICLKGAVRLLQNHG